MDTTIEHATFTAPDISCSHCVATITNTLTNLDGVVKTQVDEATKRVEVSFNPGRVSRSQIIEALDEEGYPVTS